MTTFGSNATARDRLREQLIELRDEALGRMARRCAAEPGHLPPIAGINAALDALASMPIEVKAAVRAVVGGDGRKIRLTLYREEGAAATTVLDPIRAITLAQQLIAAALPRLSSRTG
jgi:hypothetical protein